MKAILAMEGAKKPTSDQLKGALDHVEEDHHAIIFLYKSSKQINGKLMKEMENKVLQKKDLFSKTVGNMCRVLAGWKNNYASKYNRFSYANDGLLSPQQHEEQSKDYDDDTVGSSFDKYRFYFLQHDVLCLIQDKAQFPSHGYFWLVNLQFMCSLMRNSQQSSVTQ